MAKLLIVNGSPRAPRSNSKRYAALFRASWGEPVEEYEVTAQSHEALCQTLGAYDEMLLAFPLYVDGIPAALLRFLQAVQQNPPQRRPTVHVLINCGFLEAAQNETAVEMVRLFCEQNQFPYGMTLCIGSGEAILDTPFVRKVQQGVQALAQGIRAGRSEQLTVAMPLPKRLFIWASTRYWLRLGARNSLGRKEMATLQIEGQEQGAAPAGQEP